jgi:hypothetical protein
VRARPAALGALALLMLAPLAAPAATKLEGEY